MVATHKTETKYITQTEIKKKRGWTDNMIKRLLGAPDISGASKHNPTHNAKLYSLKRVLATEASASFAKRLPELYYNKSIAQKAVRTKQEKTVRWAEEVVIDLDSSLELTELYRRVCDMYEVEAAKRRTLPEDVAKRWMVNYLRHECTRYDDMLLRDLYGKVGRRAAYPVLRRRCLEMIAEQYPLLAEEAREQIHRKQRDFVDSVSELE